jgi:hypothetical protein
MRMRRLLLLLPFLGAWTCDPRSGAELPDSPIQCYSLEPISYHERITSLTSNPDREPLVGGFVEVGAWRVIYKLKDGTSKGGPAFFDYHNAHVWVADSYNLKLEVCP